MHNRCISNGLKIWKRLIQERIFKIQLHDFLETKKKCKGEAEICQKKEATPKEHQEWKYTSESKYRNRTDAFVILALPSE